MQTSLTLLETSGLLVLPVAAGLVTAGLIVLLFPWLKAYAMARPGARSSHREPTPQGGGAAVVVATLAVTWIAVCVSGWPIQANQLAAVTASAALLAIVGAIDDVHGLGPLPKLIPQVIAVGLVIAALPAELHVTLLPWWLERALLVICGIWFVNLTNFMDGIDWMTVAETVPITGAIAVLGLMGDLPALATVSALALLGSSLGFAPFNKPVARLFLGDVGSLPIGLLLAWLLLQVAANGHLAAALILPLYYLVDATLTVLRRALARELVWQAHRAHFYQRATDGGFTVAGIIARVFVLNLALVALALTTVLVPTRIVSAIALAIAAALVGCLLVRFARGAK